MRKSLVYFGGKGKGITMSDGDTLAKLPAALTCSDDMVWIDLDATLPRAYDAAHLLTATTPLDGATMDRDIAGLLQLMGDLDITIREEGS